MARRRLGRSDPYIPRVRVVHPLLFYVYPSVFLFSVNDSILGIGDLARPLLASLALGLAVWGISQGCRRWPGAQRSRHSGVPVKRAAW
jgi:hypothetical protein